MTTSGISSNSLDGLTNPETYLEKKLFTAMGKVKKNYANTICS